MKGMEMLNGSAAFPDVQDMTAKQQIWQGEAKR